MKERRSTPAVAAPQVAPPAAMGPAPAAAGLDTGLGEAEVGNAEAQERLKAQGSAGGGAPPPGAPAAPSAPPTGNGGSGTPGDLPFRAEMEKAFSQKFSDVKVVFSDPKADAISARAYTKGNEIHFADAPGKVDKRLIAHELTHVVQQRGGPKGGESLSAPGDAPEAEASRVGDVVASGQAAGPVEAAPSAGIHRDLKPGASPTPAVVPPFKEEKVADVVFQVYEDTFVGPLPAPQAKVVPCLRKDFADKRKALLDQRYYETVRTQFIALSSIKDRYQFLQKVAALTSTVADKAILGKLSVDPLLLNDAAWDSNPQGLLDLASRLDPVEWLINNLMRGDASVKLVIETWAKAYAGSCEKALTNGRVHEYIDVLGEGDKIYCLQILMGKGVLPNAPVDKLKRSMYAGDAKGFLDAWGEVVKDATVVEGLKSDANFLSEVERNVSSALDIVKAVLLNDAAPETAISFDLSDADLQVLEPILQASVKSLHAELDSTWCKDSIVLDRLRSWESQAQAVLHPIDESDLAKLAAKSRYEKAKERLKTTYQAFYGKTLELAINKGMSDGELKTALGMMQLQIIAKPAAPPATPAPGATPAAGPVVYPKRLDEKPAEYNAVQEKAASTVKALNAELSAMYCEDAVVLKILAEYQTWVDGAITAEDGEKASSDAAALRRKEAKKVVDELYLANYGRTLTDAISRGMSDAEKTTADAFVTDGARAEKAPTPKGKYSEDFDADERASVENTARTLAAKIGGEMGSLLNVDDQTVVNFLVEAQTAFQNILRPTGEDAKDPNAKALFDKKVVKAMGILKSNYDAQFGSLVGAIHQHVDDGSLMRRALELIGDRSNANKATKEAALGGLKDQATAGDYEKLFDAVNERITKLAEKMYDEAQNSKVYVSDGKMLGYCAEFQGFAGDGKRLAELSNSFPGVLAMLEAAYLPLGGSLRKALQAGLDPENVATAFSRLGFAGAAEATVPRDPALEAAKKGAVDSGDSEKAAALEKEIVAKQRVTGPVKAGSKALRDLSVSTPDMRDAFAAVAVQALGAVYTTAMGAGLADAVAAMRLVRALWKEVAGADLSQQIGLSCQTKAEVDQMKVAMGLLDPISPAKLPSQQEAEAKDVEDPSLPKIDIDKRACSPNFTIAVAKSRAIELNELLGRGKGFGAAQARVNMILSENGKKEENRVIEEVYKRIYGVDLKFKIREAYGADTEDSERLQKVAKTGGKAAFIDSIRGKVNVGNLEAIYKQTFAAKEDEKKSLREDSELMYEIRAKFGEEAMDRVFRTCTGEIKPGDLIRTRDSGKAWYNFGFGTDGEGAEEDIKEYVKSKITEMKAEEREADKGKAAKVDAENAKILRAIFADPDLQEMLDKEFSSDDLLKMRQLVMGGGKQSGTDKVMVDMKGLGTGAKILDNLREMTDAERTAKRADPAFIAWLSGDLSGSMLQEALDILYSAKGDDGKGNLENATNSSWYGNVDEDKVFDTVTGMDADQMNALAEDGTAKAKIRTNLDDEDGEKTLFNGMMKDIKDKVGPSTQDPKAPLTPEEIKRQSASLVIKHKYSILRAIYSGKDKIIGAAQACFNEKGEAAPNPAEPKVKKPLLFNGPERREVEAAVTPVLDKEYAHTVMDSDETDLEFRNVVKGAILGSKDPAGYRFDLGAAGSNNMDEMKAALENASEKTLVESWSNVKSPGAKGGTLAGVYTAYKTARDAAKAAGKDAATDEGVQSTKHAFVDFGLDISATLLQKLKQEGSWHDFMTSAGDAELLELKDLVRAKIVELPKPVIAEALGVDLATEDGAADGELLMGVDRQARSKHEHKKDTYEQQLGQGSLINPFSDKDEQVQDAWAEYSGEVGSAEVSDKKDANGKTAEVGLITEEANEAIEAKAEAFDVSVKEYKAAKAAVADAMKWIAVALITVVATALTGPGGPTLLMAMLAAGASAGVSAVIDEAVHGRDYEFIQEGLKNVVKDVAVAALTFGATKWLEAAAAQGGKIGAIMDKYKQFTAWKKALGEAATSDFGSALALASLEGVSAGFGSLSDAAVSSVDVSVWKYGFKTGMTQTGKKMGDAVGGLPTDVGKAMVKSLVESGTGAVKDKVFGPDEKDPKALPGTEEATDAGDEPEDPSVLGALGRSGKKALNPFGKEGAGGALVDQATGTATDKVLGGSAFKSSGWSGDDVGDFLKEFGKGRVDKTIEGAGEDYAEKRNAKAAFGRVKEFSAQVAGLGIPAADQASAIAHYKNYLESGAKFDGPNGALGMSPQQWVGSQWALLNSRIDANVQASGYRPAADKKADEQTLQAEYRAWLLSDPKQTDARLHRVDLNQFRGEMKEAKEESEAIKKSDAYKSLGDKRVFYDAYLADPTRLRDFESGKTADELDIRKVDGQANFEKAVVETKKQIVTAATGALTKAWPEPTQKAFTAYVAAGNAPDGLNPLDVAGCKQKAEAFATAWHAANKAGGTS